MNTERIPIEAIEVPALLIEPEDGTILNANTMAGELFGKDPEALIGDDYSGYCPEWDKECTPVAETKITTASGEELLTKARWSTVGTQRGELVYSTHEVTTDERSRSDSARENREMPAASHRRHANDGYPQRERLRHERELLEGTVDTIEDIFYIVGPDGGMQRWNSSVNKETGYSDSEVGSMSALDFFDKKDKRKISASIGEAISEGYSEVEAELVTKQGEKIPYEFRSGRLTWDDGSIRGIVGVGRNITERKQREKQLTILTEARQLRDGAAPAVGNRIVQAGKKVIEQSKKARVINSLSVDYDRREVVDVTGVVVAASNKIEGEFTDCGVECTAPQSAEAVAVPQIKDAIEELIENGVSHAQNESATVSVEVDKDGTSTTITVSDEGPHIPEQEKKALTGELDVDPLNHAEGLGMWMIHWVVETSGGSVSVSRGENGNRITVELDTPQAENPAQNKEVEVEEKCW
jgi:PAS domain S-box-containing protein